jgi:hypothetical protein
MATIPYFAAILRDASASPMLLRMRAEIHSHALRMRSRQFEPIGFMESIYWINPKLKFDVDRKHVPTNVGSFPDP